MAVEDAIVSIYLWKMVMPITCVFVAHFFFKGKYKTLYNRFYAYNIGVFAKIYGQKTVKHKKSLFEPLKLKSEQLGGHVKILEIGAGTGANFEYYPDNADVVCLDPKPEFSEYLKNSYAQCSHINMTDFVVGSADDMQFEEGSFDVVVCTLVLCSIPDVNKVLSEVRRVLKKGGQFYFFEHVSADWKKQKLLYIVQTVVSPVWRVLADGCVFNKKTWLPIKKAGFSDVKMDFLDLEVRYASMIRPHITGVATK